MKKLFIRFFKWFKSLFTKKKKKTVIQQGVSQIPKQAPVRVSNPITRLHNNRKRTKGRRTQYVGRRTIFHGPK